MSARGGGRQELRQHEVTIQALDDAGFGRAAINVPGAGERILAVRNALPGETVIAVVRHRRRGIWYAEAVWPDSHTPQLSAPDRVAAPCPAFPRCGGCALQHQAHAAQLNDKMRRVTALLAEAGDGSILRSAAAHSSVWLPPVVGPRFHYRYKARLGARWVDDRLLLGFRESFGNRVVRMSECPVLAPQLTDALPELARLLGGLSVARAIPQIELAAGDEDAAFIVRHLEPLTASDERALQAFERPGQRAVYLQPAGPDSLRAPVTGLAPAPLGYALPAFGLHYAFLPTDFTQVNPHINRALVETAVLALGLPRGALIADLFCGIGNFSLALARFGYGVRGYEASPGAILRARANADRNDLGHFATFSVADLYGMAVPDLAGVRGLVLDPPRSGAGPRLADWLQAPSLERVAYVSCNPLTFASDAVILQSAGYRLRTLRIFDMFPHTSHVETFGLFERSG